jgi:hypothetical protein
VRISLNTSHESPITRHQSLISSVRIAGLLYGAILLFEGTWAERGFSNRLACRVKRLFSLSLKSADHSHIMPHSARNIAQQLDANKFR